jgi:hypothetical protein
MPPHMSQPLKGTLGNYFINQLMIENTLGFDKVLTFVSIFYLDKLFARVFYTVQRNGDIVQDASVSKHNLSVFINHEFQGCVVHSIPSF